MGWMKIESAPLDERGHLWRDGDAVYYDGFVYAHHDGARDTSSSTSLGMKFTHFHPTIKLPSAAPKYPLARFDAAGDAVFREPQQNERGITMGYKLCTMGPGMSEESATVLAEILNKAIDANIITE